MSYIVVFRLRGSGQRFIVETFPAAEKANQRLRELWTEGHREAVGTFNNRQGFAKGLVEQFLHKEATRG